MNEPRHRRQLIDMVARPDGEVDLARASLLVACDEYPQLEVDPYLDRLDAMADGIRGRVEGPPETAIAAVNHVLFEEEGFRGNTREYYDPRNSLFNDVLDRRTGIPITLSTVYLAVGRRAGIDVEGVGLPGHFVVRVSTAGTDALVDPFHGGAVVTMQDCQDRLDRIYGRRVKLGPEMLEPCPPRALLSRMVRNLKGIYLKAEDHERALKTADLLVLLNPEAAEERRDRGLILAAMECYAMAAEDFEAYLAAAPHAAGAEQIRIKTTEMRHKAARLN